MEIKKHVIDKYSAALNICRWHKHCIMEGEVGGHVVQRCGSIIMYSRVPYTVS